MRRLVVVGAGGFGRETLDVIEAINAIEPQWDVLGVIDDAPAEADLQKLADRAVPWLGPLASHIDGFDHWFVVAVGSPSARHRLHRRLQAEPGRPATLVHPSAGLGTRVKLAPGTVICSGAQVSTNVTIGAAGHVNPNATIGHDVKIDEFVSVNPGAVVSGDVTIGTRTLIGAGAVVLQGLHLGERVVVGASACVTRDIPNGRTVKGIPAS